MGWDGGGLAEHLDEMNEIGLLMRRPSHWPLGQALCQKLTPLCWVCFMRSFFLPFSWLP